MNTPRPLVSILFLVALVVLLGAPDSFAQNGARVPPGQAIDATKGQSRICELHRLRMSKRIVPIAYGMIPMSRVEAESGEWKRRTERYPHPGDCLPATDINLTGEKRAVVYVCPNCEAAQRDSEKGRATGAAVRPPNPSTCEAIVQSYTVGAMRDQLADGCLVYDAVVFKIVSPRAKAGQTVRIHFQTESVPDDSKLRKTGTRNRFGFDFTLLKQHQLFRGALLNLERVDADGATTPERLLQAIDPAVLANIKRALERLEKAAKKQTDLFPPSSQTAYYLLAGLAVQGTAMNGLSQPEQRLFDVERRGGVRAKLISVFVDVRVALIDRLVQDKAGSYHERRAVLYVLHDGKWQETGKGAVAAGEFREP